MTIGIYHKDCNDGTTAAAVVLKKFPDAKAYPLGYRFDAAELDAILKTADPDAIIYTVDCAIGAEDMLARGFRVIALDHHIGAKERLEKLAASESRFTYIFNNDKSGASLAWSYFFPDVPVPRLITLVEDQDLWNQKYGDESIDVNNYLGLFENQPEKVVPLFDGIPDAAREQGLAISQFVNARIEELISNRKPLALTIGPHRVLAYNIQLFPSVIGNRLSIEHRQVVALFDIQGDVVKFSFRSSQGQSPSALELATILGGGGHVQAAGAGTTLDAFLEMVRS